MSNILNAGGMNFGLVRTKEGIPRIKNPNNISKWVWRIINEEVKEGKYTIEDCLKLGENING